MKKKLLNWSIKIVMAATLICVFGVNTAFAVDERDIDNAVKIAREYGLIDSSNVLRILNRFFTAIDSDAIVTVHPSLPNVANTNVFFREKWPEDIIYYKISYFDDIMLENLTQNLECDITNTYAGIIFDIRGAGGTSTAAVARIASFFLEENKDLCIIVNKKSKISVPLRAIKSTRMELPFVVIVDSFTSHAAEVLARVIKGNRNVVIIGSPTAGKVSFPELINISSNIVVNLPVQIAESVNSNSVWNTSMEPDVNCYNKKHDSVEASVSSWKPHSGKEISERAKNDAELMRKVEGDYVLRRAVDILLGIKVFAIPTAESK